MGRKARVAGAVRASSGMLSGKMWQYTWGSRRELVDVYHYLKEKYPLTGVVYGKRPMFGIREDRSLPPGVWLFETEET